MSPRRFRSIAWLLVIAAVASLGAYGYRLSRRSALEAQYMDDAERAQHMGDFVGAEQSYQRALTLDPRFLPARVGLADVYELRGQVERSLAEYRKAVELDPRNPEAHAALGQTLISYQRYPEAIRCFERGLEMAPNEAHMRLMLTSCYRRNGQLEKAKRSLVEYGRLAPGSTATASAIRAIAREAKQEQPLRSGRSTSSSTKGADK